MLVSRTKKALQAPKREPVLSRRHPILSKLRPTRTNLVMASLPRLVLLHNILNFDLFTLSFWVFSSHSWLRYFHQSFLREWLTNAVPTTEPPPAMLAALSTNNNNRDMPVSPELLSSGNLFSNLKFEGSAGEKPRGRLVHRATPPTLHSVFTGPFFSPLPRYFYLSKNSQQPQTYFLQVEDLSNEEEVSKLFVVNFSK